MIYQLNETHKSAELIDIVNDIIKRYIWIGLTVSSHDNANNMPGSYSGVQA